jgi:hypothetical protein
LGRQEADQRRHEQAGVELPRPVVLSERLAFGVVSTLTHLVVDVLAQPTPALGGPLEVQPLHRLDGSVHGHPGHDLGVGEVPAGSSDLPDAFVWLVPGRLQEVEQAPLELPRRGAGLDADPPSLVHGVHDLAVHIELELAAGRVANANRLGARITGEPLQLLLRQATLAGRPVHDL